MNKNEILIFSGGKFSKLYCLDYFEEGVFETGALIGRTAQARGWRSRQLWRAAVKQHFHPWAVSVSTSNRALNITRTSARAQVLYVRTYAYGYAYMIFF